MEENENVESLNSLDNEEPEDFLSTEENDSQESVDELESDGSETSEELNETEESSDSSDENLLREICERLERIEEFVCQESEVVEESFLDKPLSDLSALEGMVLLLLLIAISAVIKDWIGGLLESCIRR